MSLSPAAKAIGDQTALPNRTAMATFKEGGMSTRTAIAKEVHLHLIDIFNFNDKGVEELPALAVNLTDKLLEELAK